MKNTLKGGTAFFICSLVFSTASLAQDYLADRGTGIPTSMFGTYIDDGEFFLYPFYEYYYNQNEEYNPKELGYNVDEDFEGRYIGHEALIYGAYGFNEWIMAEFEIAVIGVTLEKSDEDRSTMPNQYEESGLGDVEGQIRWRYNKESRSMPEFFSFFEIVTPAQKDQDVELIGTKDWELKLGVGVVKGFRWGTFTLRTSTEYDAGEETTEAGEFALEYLKRVSSKHSIYTALEGAQDDVSTILEWQWHFKKDMTSKIGTGIGITEEATDFAPELGVLFRF